MNFCVCVYHQLISKKKMHHFFSHFLFAGELFGQLSPLQSDLGTQSIRALQLFGMVGLGYFFCC